ncbi:MAG: hypothetical protein PVF46_06145, partial [Lysobacterales bacterium]
MIAIDTVRDDTFFSEHIEDGLSPWLADAQVYRNTSSVSSWTIPAVATIFTGLYPVQHSAGLFRNQPANLDVDLPSALDESLISLADILTGAQFRTAAFSAHPWINAKFGLAQGFEQLHPLDGWQAVNSKFYEWLDQRADSPGGQQRFFGYLHLMEAHDWHLEPLPELETRLAGIEPGLLELLRADVTRAACANEGFKACKSNQVYNLAVREVRVAIAEVLQNLEERGLLEDTL